MRNIALIKLLLKHKCIQANTPDGDGDSPLHTVCWSGGPRSVKALETLLQHEGIQINMQNKLGRTPLHNACHNRHFAIVNFLLQHPGIFLNTRDREEGSPLHAACGRGGIRIVKLLLAHEDVNVNIKDKKGRTALFICVSKLRRGAVYAEMTRLLLQDQRVNVNEICNDHGTVLDYAIDEGIHEVIEMLRLRGARISLELDQDQMCSEQTETTADDL